MTTSNKICFFCGKEIENTDAYWLEPIDGTYPDRYGNLFFHKELCYRKIEDIHQYLNDNVERVYKVLSKNVGNKIINKVKVNLLEFPDVIEDEETVSEKVKVKTRKSKIKNVRRKK